MNIVDLSFRIRGTTIPVDHGYALFASMVRLIPELHGNPGIGIHPIRGDSMGNGLLMLSAKSRLAVRMEAENIPLLLPLSGRQLSIIGHDIHSGVPQVIGLKPSPNLYSRITTIKGFMDKEEFQEALARQMADLGVSRFSASIGARRTLRIQDKRVVGFQVKLRELSPEDSLTVQSKGLGGRRRFGCGLFNPFKPEANGK